MEANHLRAGKKGLTQPNMPINTYLRGCGSQGGADRDDWTRGLHTPGFSSEFKLSLRKPGPGGISVAGLGACLTNHRYLGEIDKEKIGAWGIPILRIGCKWGENERAMSGDIALLAAPMLASASVREMSVIQSLTPPGRGIPEMGTTSMSRDPKTSFFTPDNQAHDVNNLSVSDGACITSSSYMNPSPTSMALTARACHYGIPKVNKGEL